MKRRESVTKIMSENVVTLCTKDSLQTAEDLFNKHHIRHIPVVENNHVIGMLSLTDLMRISFVDNFDTQSNVDTAVYNMLNIEQVMVHKVETVDVSKTIKDIAEILSDREYHALPVTEGRDLVGIVTTTDLIKYLLEQY